MKKSTLLSLATAGAIVATSFGTFALWDTTEATASADLALRKPVTVTANTPAAFSSTTDLGSIPVYATDVTFTAANSDQVTGAKITLATTIKQGATDVTANFDVTYTEVSGTGLTDNVDSTVTDSNQYKVSVTPKDTDEAKALANGAALTVDVTGTLSK